MNNAKLLLALLGLAAPTFGATYNYPGTLVAQFSGSTAAKFDESSGLAASRLTANVFWTHEDSNNSNKIYAIDTAGKLRATVTVKNSTNKDWEDIASFTYGGKAWLAIADTGNNDLTSDKQEIYLVPEPALSATSVNVGYTLSFSYSDENRNVEAMAVDTVTKKIYLCEKDDDGDCWIYELPLTFANKTLTATKVAKIYTWSGEDGEITGMDISPDGKRMILCAYVDGLEFTRTSAQTWNTVLTAGASNYVLMPARYQGESICYGTDGLTLWLGSEIDGAGKIPLWKLTAQ